MLRATTLVHKGALPIAKYAIKSFALHFGETHELAIHTDSTVSKEDCESLLKAAQGIRSEIVTSQKRKELIKENLSGFKNIQTLIGRGGYFNKLEIAMMEKPPYFFFDSDILWLKHVEDFRPPTAVNAFSTETWSAYSGIAKPALWVKSKTPRRVNSGFYYLNESFPYKKFEDFLTKGMFNSLLTVASDQEIFAYLYNDLEYFHPADLKRGRFESDYKLKDLTCAAMHFPGGMWQYYMDQIKQLPISKTQESVKMRFLPPVGITRAEILHMRIRTWVGNSKPLNGPLNLLRRMLRRFRR